jgi:asparagine synthase (glutamine-hydrolysing)
MNSIAGIISAHGIPALAHPPCRMIERMCHDPSQVHGAASYPSVGLSAGWVGPRSMNSGVLPARSPSARTEVILTGDHPANGAAILADAWERTSIQALGELNGSFSGIVIDRRQEAVTLFNDRYGLGRIYFHESARGFFFASEAKSLLAVLPHLRSLDPQGLAEFFSVGCVLQNRSLFRGISLLPPGSAWTFHRDGRIEKTRYFDPSTWEQQEPLTATAYNERLREVLTRVVNRRSDGERTALSLTGGLDSRAVMACSNAEAGSLPCYTFGGPYRDCADVLIARRLAGLCRHPHTTIRVGDDFFPRFWTLAEKAVYLSDGTMDVSGAVELHVNEQAREIAPVRLTGNYGSEILRSHVAFGPGRLDRTLFTPEFNTLIDAAAETYRAEARCHRLSFIAFKQVPWHHYGRLSIERSQLIPRSPFLDNDLVALAYRAPGELRLSPQPLLNLIARGNPTLASVGTDRALRSRNLPLVSRAARLWQDFTAKAEYAYDYGMPRWLTRTDRMLTRLHLERTFLGRHKFYHFRIWYRDRLGHSVRAMGPGPGADTLSFCYRKGAGIQIIDEHLSGRVNRTLELHKLLTVQLVSRSLLQPQ